MTTKGSNDVAKYGIAGLNVAFMIPSILAFIVGIVYLTNESAERLIVKTTRYFFFNNQYLMIFQKFHVNIDVTMFGYLLVLVGLIAFLTCFLGFHGAMKGSRFSLGLYGAILLFLLFTQFGCLQMIYGNAKVTKELLKTTIEKNYISAYDELNGVRMLWDNIMVKMECCGANDYKDFQNAKLDDSTMVPKACCIQEKPRQMFSKPIDESCPYEPTPLNSFMNRGCYNAIFMNCRTIFVIGAIIGFQSLVLAQVAALFKTYKREQREPFSFQKP